MILFRCDASNFIGSGHVMRCLTLAHLLREAGKECVFACSQEEGDRIAFIRSKGYEVRALPPLECQETRPYCETLWSASVQQQDACDTLSLFEGKMPEWVVVDHYGFDAGWENVIHQKGWRIFVIDDLANRSHQCDGLLDQTYGRVISDYAPFLCKRDTPVLLGSRYALLRDEFAQAREESLRKRDACVPERRLNIAMGGMDPHNTTEQVLDGLLAVDVQAEVDVVMSSSAVHLQSVKRWVAEHGRGVTLHIDPSNIPELFAQATLAIGAAGATSWERATLGLPMLLVAFSPNQRWLGNALEQARAAEAFDWAQTGKGDGVAVACRAEALFLEPKSVRAMSEAVRELCDGKGAQRVAEWMLSFQ